MAAHAHKTHDPADEALRLGDRAKPVINGFTIAGAIGLALALLLALFSADGLRRFYFAYLTGYAFCLSIALGAQIFVLTQHLCRAGWSVSVRRLAENLSATLPILFALTLPILVSVWFQHGDLYRWALPLSAAAPSPAVHKHEVPPGPKIAAAAESHVGQTPHGEAKGAGVADEGGRPTTLDTLTLKKRPYLNPWFFTLRIFLYFGIWCFIARWFRQQSLLQDQTGDPEITNRMQRMAAPALIAVGLALTFGAFDLFMSLDPHWYSTMFGVYYFAGSFLAFFAALIVIVYLFQKAGLLRESITVEHYHDLGKFLFGFVFFWGYIAFSQYMLLWYANIPEETEYLSRHGLTTVRANMSGWTWVGLALLFGQLLIPFAGLLGRESKRNKNVLFFWAIWILVFHYVDMVWVVLPELRQGFQYNLIDVVALIGMIGVVGAAMLRSAAGHDLRPVADPRLPETLAFQNV